MKWQNSLLSVILTLIIVDRASLVDTPHLIGKSYFLVGGAECVQYSLTSESVVDCFDEDMKYTGWRANMTTEQLEMYKNYHKLK